MKLNRINSIMAKSAAVIAACAALNASAGTAPAPKGPAPVAPAPSALFDSIGATLDVAYDSRYYFRGLWFADNIVTTALNVAIPLIGGAGEDGGSLTLGLGAVYINTMGTPFNNPGQIGVANARSKNNYRYSEFDAIGSLTYDAGWAKFATQYQYYFYPDHYAGSFNGLGTTSSFGVGSANDPEYTIKGAGELGFTATIPLGAANIYAGYYYDFRVNGSYFSLGGDYTFAVTDWLSIVPSIWTGYGIDYYTGNRSSALAQIRQPGDGRLPTSGFTHVIYSIAAPVKITKSCTFTPYVALNESLQLRSMVNAQRNETFWGAKLSLTF